LFTPSLAGRRESQHAGIAQQLSGRALRLPPHTASRHQRLAHLTMGTLRAVVFDLRLLPTRPVKDFHLLSSAHARHTYARPP